ncbi:MAG: hypothetical protein WA991_03910 [Ornithinimicrobium sp.]
MASYVEGSYRSFEAGADLSDNAYQVVKTDADGKAVLATAATDAIVGVIEKPSKAGETTSVAMISGAGTYKVKTGANVAKDAYLTTNGSGLAISTTTSGNRVFGRALTAGTSGDVIEYVKCNEKY